MQRCISAMRETEGDTGKIDCWGCFPGPDSLIGSHSVHETAVQKKRSEGGTGVCRGRSVAGAEIRVGLDGNGGCCLCG